MKNLPTAENLAAGSGWSRTRRRVATAGLLLHLVAVIAAPLSLNGAYQSLLWPVRFLRGYATALYLDHGYRFFAPDPGPTHTIRMERTRADGRRENIRLPDSGRTWPRLLYHRWFMLGESLANEVSATLVGYADFAEYQARLARRIADLREKGRGREASLVQRLRDDNQREFDRHWRMLLALSNALRRRVAREFPGESVRIFSRRQLIPQPHDIRLGRSMDEPEFVEEVEVTDPAATLKALQPEEVLPPGDSGQ
jgi:hypothetical protein